MWDRVRRVLRIERAEVSLFRSLFLLHFLVIAAFTLGKTARDGLYLDQLPARSLPLIYLAVALWTAFAVWAYGRLTRGLASHRALAAALVLVAGATVLFYLGFRTWRQVTAVLFYLWSAAAGLLLVSQFWTLANDRTDSRQARRLFGTISAGGIAGGLAGGALASILGTRLGPELLLLITSVVYLMAVPAALRCAPSHDSHRLSPVGGGVEGMRKLMKRPYVRLIALGFLMSGMAAAILDYQFKLSLQNSMVGSGRMTAFLGSFYGAQNLIALFIQLGLTGFILSRVGAQAAGMSLPVGLMVGVFVVFGAPGLVAVAGLRLFESTMRISIAGTAWEFLYVPLPDDTRRQARRVIDLIVNRNAEAGAGLLILIVNLLFGGTLVQITAVLAVVVAAWLVIDVLLGRAYVRELSSSLKRMVVDVESGVHTLRETRVFTEIESLLESPYEAQVLYAMDLLERLDKKKILDRLPILFHHSSARVRLKAIALGMEQPEAVDLLDMEALLHDPEPEIGIHAALFFSRLTPGNPIDNMSDLLSSGDPQLRSSAFQVVAEHSPPSEDVRVEELARVFLERGTLLDRAAVASAAGRRPAPSRLHAWIPRLMRDDETVVRRAAIRSAGQAAGRELIPLLIDHLVNRADREEARSALAAFGERVIGTIGDYLVDPTVDLRLKRELPRVLAMIGTQDAADSLLRASLQEDLALGYQVLKALNRIRSSNAKVTMWPNTVSPQIRAEAEGMTRLLVRGRTLEAIPGSRARELLMMAIAEKKEAALERLFRRLALLYPPREVRLAYVGLNGDNARIRAQSVEYMESILAPDDRRFVMPLIDTSPEDERVNNASSVFRMKPLPVEDSMRDLLAMNDSWLSACVLYLAGTLELGGFRDLVRASLSHPEVVVRDTAQWASARLQSA
jgi:AAA family ATP:ADP antiporter